MNIKGGPHKENTDPCDACIKESILNHLSEHPYLPLEKIDFTVKYGIVTIFGNIPWEHQKMLISALLHKVKGVQEVLNNICVENELFHLSLDNTPLIYSSIIHMNPLNLS